MIRKIPQIHAAMLAACICAIYKTQRTGCRQLNFYFIQINRFIKNVSNKLLFEIDKIFLLRFNATFYWIQINIFIIVNKYLADSI